MAEVLNKQQQAALARVLKEIWQFTDRPDYTRPRPVVVAMQTLYPLVEDWQVFKGYCDTKVEDDALLGGDNG